VVVCLEQGADMHTAQLMPLPLTFSCFSKIQIGFTFLVPAYPGCPGKEAVKWLCVCVCFSKIEWLICFYLSGTGSLVCMYVDRQNGCYICLLL